MSIFEDDNENYMLYLYKEAVDCFRKYQLEVQENANDPIQKLQSVHVILANLQQLINLEDNNFFPLCQLDAKPNLLLIYEHLLLHEKVHSQNDHKPKSLVIIDTVDKVTNCTKKISKTQEKNSFREIAAGLKTIPKVKGLQDIAGLTDVKKVLATIVILPVYQPQLYAGHKICNSVLLYGPPGTGKTLLAHGLAAEISAHFISVNSSDILSQYVGQTEKMLQAVFESIKEPRNKPTILFIDEIDGLCRSRKGSESEWCRRFKTEFMCQLSSFEDLKNVFLICATNCPWDLDTAFLRRFQRRIYIPLPDAFDRYAILQLLGKNSNIEMSSMSRGALLSRTEGYSGSDLADVIRNALNLRITELLDVKRWTSVENDKYQAVPDHEIPTGSIINCNLLELPQESMKVRDPHVGDIMAALDVVRPTVSESDVRQYEQFMINL